MPYLLLIDLDDTLLATRIPIFQKAYLQALTEHFSLYVPAEAFIPTMNAAIKAMGENNDPKRTLKECFDQVFYSRLRLDPAIIQPHIDTFYKDVFPQLKSITSPIHEAIDLVNNAIEMGFKIAIATNPYFPKSATYQRLDWAGISPDRVPYEIVSTYESFHFTKPNPSYFAELLAQIGWPDETPVMIGNDYEMDIVPAINLGISAYWINNEQEAPIVDTISLHGSLEKVLETISSVDIASHTPRYNTPTALVSILQSTPAALASILSPEFDIDYGQKLQVADWSPTEILCHLRDVEIEINYPRLKRILNEENPFISGVDSDSWVSERAYAKQDPTKAMEQFIESRLDTISILENMTPHDWSRPINHAIFGPSTLRELVDVIACHDRAHIQKLKQSLDKQQHL